MTNFTIIAPPSSATETAMRPLGDPIGWPSLVRRSLRLYRAAFVLRRNRNAIALKRNPATRPSDVASFAFQSTCRRQGRRSTGTPRPPHIAPLGFTPLRTASHLLA